MTEEIIWEEPPPRFKRTVHHDWLAAIQAFPGRPARRNPELLVVKDANALAGTLRNAAGHLGGKWDISARAVPGTGGKYGVWATFVGADTPEDEVAPEVPTEKAVTDAKAHIDTAMRTHPGTGVPMEGIEVPVGEEGEIEIDPWDEVSHDGDGRPNDGITQAI